MQNFLYISVGTVVVFALLGDKLLLFLLDAREVDISDVELSSYVSNYSCKKSIKELKLYRYHSVHIEACFIGSLLGLKSLVISESLLLSAHREYLLDKILVDTVIERSFVDDLAIILSYVLFLPGYFFNSFSTILREAFFFVMAPIYILKSNLAVQAISVNSRKLVESSNLDMASESKSLIVKDIINDFGTIKENDYLLKGLWKN